MVPGICVASLEFRASKCVVSTARKTHPPCWSPLDGCGNYKCKNRPRHCEPVYLSSHVNSRSFLISPSSIHIARGCAAQPETFLSSPRLCLLNLISPLLYLDSRNPDDILLGDKFHSFRCCLSRSNWNHITRTLLPLGQ